MTLQQSVQLPQARPGMTRDSARATASAITGLGVSTALAIPPDI
jgi:hypothetical protein